MEEKYIIEYIPDPNRKIEFHYSYIHLIQMLSHDVLCKELKKHMYPHGRYIAHISMEILHTPVGNSHLLCNNTLKLTVISKHNRRCIGFGKFDFLSDNLICIKIPNRTRPFYAVDPSGDILLGAPKPSFYNISLFPSEAEFEEIGRQSAESFAKSLQKFRFSCELIAADFPDIVFEISYDQQVDSALRQSTFRVLEKWVAQYNRRKEKEGGETIHFAQLTENTTENKNNNTVYIHIDFGNCTVTLLKNALAALNRSSLPIKSVALI